VLVPFRQVARTSGEIQNDGDSRTGSEPRRPATICRKSDVDEAVYVPAIRLTGHAGSHCGVRLALDKKK